MIPLLFAAAALAAPTRGLEPVQPTTTPSGEMYRRQVALVIGIDDYPDDSMDLSYAVADAKAVASRLRERFGYDDVIELYNEDATRAAVLTRLTELASLHPDDALFVFWAGHGIHTETASGETIGYLVPRDGTIDPTTAAVSNISMDDIRTLVGRSVPARHRFLVADTCYSGMLATRSVTTVPDADAAWLARNRNRDTFQVLTAGQDDETVLDTGPGGHSVFTARLLEALDEADDYTTASELAVHVQRTVRADAWMRGGHAQNPAFGRVAGTADFVLAPITAPPLPPPGPRRSRHLAGVAAGSFIIGAAGITTASLTRQSYVSSDLSAGPQPDIVRLNRTAGITGYTALGATGILLGTAVVVREW